MIFRRVRRSCGCAQRSAGARFQDILLKSGRQIPPLLSQAVDELFPDKAVKASVSAIKAAVCAKYHLEDYDLTCASRVRALTWPRQEAMWLTRRYTTRSLPQIGRLFGGRDHTTVLYAVRAVNCRIICAEDYARRIPHLLKRLQNEHPEQRWQMEMKAAKALSALALL